MKARLGNVMFGTVRIVTVRLKSAELGNVKVQRSFSEADKARHLQLHLPGPCNSQVGNNKETEHQQFRRS